MDDACELSLILPAYNEEAGIAQAVIEADDALRQLGISYEVIVVDDGSRDATAAMVAQVDRPCVRLVQHGANRGYGAALRTGFETARGRRIAFTDADCQFDLADLGRLLPLTEQHPIAVGYRVDRQDSWLRKFYSRGYNLLARSLLGARVRDIDCALKVFRREALERILPEANGFFVNTEMLTRARQLRMPVAEVGVRHRLRREGESKVSILDIPRTLRALLPFWWMRVMFPAEHVATARHSSSAKRNQGFLMCLLLLMTAMLFFARLDHPLLEPDEARYAEIPRQMLLEGRVLTRVLHQEDYWPRPPLLYWLVMASYKVFGVHDWAARLVPCLAGIGTVMITASWGWRTIGPWTGLASGVILTLSMRFLYLAGMLSMDGLLCTFVLAGLACGHIALRSERRVLWLMLSAAACALGVLTKGPVAVLLIGVPLVTLTLLDRRCRRLSPLDVCVYLGIAALIAGPWFMGMAINAPDAAGSFVGLHHLARYFAPIDHERPAWYYVPSLLLGMLPWSLLLIPLVPYFLRKSRSACARRPAALGAFVLAFAWCVLLGCKWPASILAALPMLTLILGTFVTHGMPWRRWGEAPALSSQRWIRRLTAMTFAVAAALSAAAGLSDMWSWPAASAATLLFTAGGIVAAIAPMRGPSWLSWAGCAGAVFLVVGFGQRTWLPDYHDRFGLRRQVVLASEYEQEEMPIVTYPKRWDSVSYYSRRDDVSSYAPAELAKLVHDLHQHGKAIVYVRRSGSLRELQNALPENMELELLGRDDDFIAVGVVRRR